MSEAKALASGFTPKARLIDWMYVSQDPREELLLGPAYAVTRLLARNGLRATDVDV
jgi:acetyl-CoA acyltransferase